MLRRSRLLQPRAPRPPLPEEEGTHPSRGFFLQHRERGEGRGRICGSAHAASLSVPSPRGGLIAFPPGGWSGGGVVSGCWGLQAHRTLCLSLSVRYRLWETGNVCETGQTGGGKRLHSVFSGKPGRVVRRHRVFPSPPCPALSLHLPRGGPRSWLGSRAPPVAGLR